jgi:hypothetical protein
VGKSRTPNGELNRVWRLYRSGWEPEDIAAYMELSKRRVEAYLAVGEPPSRNGIDEADAIAVTVNSIRDRESPGDISDWERYIDGGVVRWRQPK